MIILLTFVFCFYSTFSYRKWQWEEMGCNGLGLGVLCWTYRGMKIYNQRKNPSNLVRSSQSASFHIAAQRQGKTRSKKLQTGQKNKEGQVNYTPHSDSKFIFSSTSKVSTLTKKIMSIIRISISSTGKHFSALILGWKL